MGQDQADTVPGQRFSSIETVVLPKGVSVNENNGQPEARYDIDNEQMHLSNPTSPEPDTQGTAITESSGNGQCFCNPCQYATLTQSANQAENVPARIISFCSNNGSGETPWDPNMLPKAGDFCRMLSNVDEESPSTRYTQAYIRLYTSSSDHHLSEMHGPADRPDKFALERSYYTATRGYLQLMNMTPRMNYQ